MDQKYKMLEHTGDISIRAFGSSRREVFINSALGMTEYLFGKEIFKKETTKSQKITVQAPDLKSLLVDWLSELLYLSDTNYRAYTKFTIEELTDTKITAILNSCKAQAQDDIKAVTYYNLQIEKKGDKWETTVTYDI